jgi:hypothetical protein
LEIILQKESKFFFYIYFFMFNERLDLLLLIELYFSTDIYELLIDKEF